MFCRVSVGLRFVYPCFLVPDLHTRRHGTHRNALLIMFPPTVLWYRTSIRFAYARPSNDTGRLTNSSPSVCPFVWCIVLFFSGIFRSKPSSTSLSRCLRVLEDARERFPDNPEVLFFFAEVTFRSCWLVVAVVSRPGPSSFYPCSCLWCKREHPTQIIFRRGSLKQWSFGFCAPESQIRGRGIRCCCYSVLSLQIGQIVVEKPGQCT